GRRAIHAAHEVAIACWHDAGVVRTFERSIAKAADHALRIGHRWIEAARRYWAAFYLPIANNPPPVCESRPSRRGPLTTVSKRRRASKPKPPPLGTGTD